MHRQRTVHEVVSGSLLNSPSWRMRDVADNGLPARLDRDVLDRDLLLSSGPIPLQGLHLGRERPGQLVVFATPEPDGRLLITPECASFEEVEGQINSLQDELDEIRETSTPSLPSRLKSMLLQKKSDDQS